jgi:hypothetical protein
MLALPLLSLLACETPAPPYTPDLSAYTGAEAACIQAECGTSASADAFAACRTEQCAPLAESWAVNPTLLRYDDGVVTVSVQVEHTPGSSGKHTQLHVGDTWLGATVLTSKGEEIDMAVQTVFPDRLGEPFTFSSQVGPDVEVVIVGLWGKKIEPCDSSRSGCQMFGFVLDQSLAAWPVDTYVASPPRRQRFLPAEMTVQVAAAAMSPERQKALADAMAPVWAAEQQRFGTTFALADWAVADGAASEVVHKSVHDGPLASRLAATLGAEVTVRHDAAAGADLAVRLSATACPPGPVCK